MIDQYAMEKLGEFVSSKVERVNDRAFHVSKMGAAAVQFPTPKRVDVFSLTQIVTYLKTVSDPGVPLVLNVVREDKVEVFEKKLNANGQRSDVLAADFSEICETFPCEQKMSQEDFIIKLMTMFVKNPERDGLIKTVASVRAEKVQTSDDDGVSQVAQTKAGVMLTTEKKIENIWMLQPFKTFPEIEQPTVPYMLRLHQRGDEMPTFALYDCDGGRWKVSTTVDVREYLVKELGDVKHVAVL